MIQLKSPQQIEMMKIAGRITGEALLYAKEFVCEGITTKEIDEKINRYIKKNGAKPTFLGYGGFPGSACISVNEVVIHGIPSNYILQDGDIVSVDIGSNLNGFFGDSARTYPVGNISKSDEDLIACSKDALYYAIDEIRAGMHFKELCYKLEQFILGRGYVPLKGFCGHGIGRRPHEEPEIPNYLEGATPKAGPKIRNGMVFCIEPMICQKDGTPKIAADKWTVTSVDGLRTAHYEHCIAVVNGRAEILSVAD